MLKLVKNLHYSDLGLALSGGIDSMCIAHFLLNGRKDFTAFYFNHGTSHGRLAEEFVSKWCEANGVKLVLGHIKDCPLKDVIDSGAQEYYRKCRYHFFHQQQNTIILAHHLDDVLETWLFSSMHGDPKLIPYSNGNCIRPFLLSTKDGIKRYAKKYGVEWIEDESNGSVMYMRNRIRHNIVPEVEIINPGIRKVLAKKIKLAYN